jgi:hypothetical protein
MVVSHFDFRIEAQLGQDPPLWVSNESNMVSVGTPWVTTTVQVTAAPTSVTFNQPVTLTATVAPIPAGSGTPTGTVYFLIPSGANASGFGSAPLTLVNGVDEATLTTPLIPLGLDGIEAEYNGRFSSPVYVTRSLPSNTGAPGPEIIGALVLNTGTGKHKHLVGFELIFNEALDPSRAANAANYAMDQSVKHGRKLVAQPVKLRVEYTLGTDTVSLLPEGEPQFTRGGQLVVSGTPPSGITGATGAYLDSPGNGLPGTKIVIAILTKARTVVL